MTPRPHVLMLEGIDGLDDLGNPAAAAAVVRALPAILSALGSARKIACTPSGRAMIRRACPHGKVKTFAAGMLMPGMMPLMALCATKGQAGVDAVLDRVCGMSDTEIQSAVRTAQAVAGGQPAGGTRPARAPRRPKGGGTGFLDGLDDLGRVLRGRA